MAAPLRLPPPSPLLATDLRPLAVPPERRFRVAFTLGDPSSVARAGFRYKTYGINGALYGEGGGGGGAEGGGVAVARRVPVGVVEEWTIVSDGSAGTGNHAFHLHLHHFQVVGVEPSPAALGMDAAVGEWRDTVAVPSPGSVTVRFNASDFAGRTLLHCHVVPHEDEGMMAVVEFVHE